MAVPTPSLRLRIRVFNGTEAALGPGRIELLSRVAESGSIVQAARDMELSYMKAWKLIQSMNRCFQLPLVEVRRGGKDGGSAHLTDTGTKVLSLYREMYFRACEVTLSYESAWLCLLAPLTEGVRSPEANSGPGNSRDLSP